jgi:hypothetical protein
MENKEPLLGRCLCGAVQFEVTPPTDFHAHCHCKSCRLSRGTPFVSWTSVPKDQFRLIQGKELLTWYRSSESILWGFCKTCGSSMLYQADKKGHPESPKIDRIYVSVGSLDKIDRPPVAHVSYEEKAPWFNPEDHLDKYRGKGEEKLT